VNEESGPNIKKCFSQIQKVSGQLVSKNIGTTLKKHRLFHFCSRVAKRTYKAVGLKPCVITSHYIFLLEQFPVLLFFALPDLEGHGQLDDVQHC
jgi:hypothetical protein